MPHDAYGHALNIGDVVYIAAKVKEIQQTADYCNVTVETEKGMFPSDTRTTLHLNAHQVEKIFNRQNPPAHTKLEAR